MNNLAYYLAERKEKNDLEIARKYVEYIRAKSEDFPMQRAAWLDTYDFVLKQSTTEEDKEVAAQK